jgi:hypothetical protein
MEAFLCVHGKRSETVMSLRAKHDAPMRAVTATTAGSADAAPLFLEQTSDGLSDAHRHQ